LTYTSEEAVEILDKLADECENENYHTEAGVIWDSVIPAVREVRTPTTLMLVVYDGLRIFEIKAS
jgi:hypothetical protein